MKRIAPSILSANFALLQEEIEAVERAGADWIHVDVMDGRYVPNITIGPPVIRSLRKVTKLPFDVHLMIEEPERHIQAFRDAGADILSVHPEATRHLQRTLSMIREAGAKPAVALNPATPLFVLDHIWSDIDMVLLMSVNPGFSGQKFIPDMMQKIRSLRKKSERYAQDLLIEVDGGVDLGNISELHEAGVDVFVSGSTLFESKDYGETIRQMRQRMS